MKNVFIALALLICLPCCKKTNTKTPAQVAAELQATKEASLNKDYTVNAMYICPGGVVNMLDTTGNYYDDMGLWGPVSSSPICSFFSSQTRWYQDWHVYRVRYVPDLPLLDSFVTTEINLIQSHFIYRMNQALARKEIFEVYDTLEHKIVSKIYGDTMLTIYAECLRTPYDPVAFRAALNYYFTKMHVTVLYYYRQNG